ncbi:MAG: hypothetical protein QNK37_08085 [Acidobacteriota bacterium]|nr:hypothetical protein [Acidobacteriota bacterium]
MTGKDHDRAKPLKVRTLPGVGLLAVDAVTGITDLVEQLHHTILHFGAGSQKQKRTRGITGMVYRNIRSITGLVGDGLDGPLHALNDLFQPDHDPAHEAPTAALNGVLGDHLVARGNPLAIPMQLRVEGKALNPEDLSGLLQKSEGKLVIMVHGLCMNDLQWTRKGHNHGDLLARNLGVTTVYLHYNTGRHISENGRCFANLLEARLESLQQPVSLALIGHSIGGLVIRSACHYGKKAGHRWLPRLRKLVCLGSPHHGAPLEKVGNFLDAVLEISPYSAPFSRLGKVRSSGITDLRYGNVIDEDWQDRDRFARTGDHRKPVPLPDGVSCYAMAATTGTTTSGMSGLSAGDGLVPVDSALGRHEKFDLDFPREHQWICEDTRHLDLLSSRPAYDKLRLWLESHPRLLRRGSRW